LDVSAEILDVSAEILDLRAMILSWFTEILFLNAECGLLICHDGDLVLGVFESDHAYPGRTLHDFHMIDGLKIFTCENPDSAFEFLISAFCTQNNSSGNENGFFSEKTTSCNAQTGYAGIFHRSICGQ